MMSGIVVALTIFSLSINFSQSGIKVYDAGRERIAVKFHGEDIPEPLILRDQKLVLFYPATYRVAVYAPGNRKVLDVKLLNGHFELESYSAFDANDSLIAVAYRHGDKTRLKILQFNGKTRERIFKKLYPAGLWIRGGKIILRLYEVKNGHVTRDFVKILDDETDVSIRGIIAVDYVNGKPVFATRKEIIMGSRKIPVSKSILDLRVKNGKIYVLLDCGDGVTSVATLQDKRISEIKKVSGAFRRFFEVKDRLVLFTPKGESYEF